MRVNQQCNQPRLTRAGGRLKARSVSQRGSSGSENSPTSAMLTAKYNQDNSYQWLVYDRMVIREDGYLSNSWELLCKNRLVDECWLLRICWCWLIHIGWLRSITNHQPSIGWEIWYHQRDISPKIHCLLGKQSWETLLIFSPSSCSFPYDTWRRCKGYQQSLSRWLVESGRLWRAIEKQHHSCINSKCHWHENFKNICSPKNPMRKQHRN